MTEQQQAEPTYGDVLSRFIDYADRLDSLMGARTRPAYFEECPCGGSLSIGNDVPPAERKQLWRHFIARHQHCADARTPDRDCVISPESREADRG